MELTVRAPQTESEWTAYYDLRFRVLRQPWGQPIGSERDNSEDNAYHFALYNEATLIAVVRLDEKNKGEFQVRYMAVEPGHQGQGMGKILFEYVMDYCASKNATEIILHSREIAIPFYSAMNFEIVEKSHLLFNEIQHYLMRKID
jgi:GNAT superfamily N-acetyltransferase